MSSNITLKDVAAKAGVSLSTAAAALRGEAYVKPATLARVVKVAEKLRYRRNSAASIMSTLRNRHSHKSAFVVWLTALPEASRLGETWRIAPQHAAAEAKKLGLQFEHINMEHPDEIKGTIKRIDAQGCGGIVIGPTVFPVVDQVNWNRFSVISSEGGASREGFDIVRTDQFRTTLKLLRQIKASGFKRIGICLREHEPLHADDEARFGASSIFLRYDVKAGNRIPVLSVPFRSQNFDDELVSWAKKNKPDVILGFSMTDSLCLAKHGISVPDDINWVSLHVEEYNRGKAAGLQFNQEIIPEYAIRLLFEKIGHGVRGLSVHSRETIVKPILLAGQSCPRLPGDEAF